jgi:hypothetical protein
MKTKSYDFSYKANGDTYTSDEYESLSLAKQEVERLRKIYKDDFRVIETWIYNSDGVFVGRW